MVVPLFRNVSAALPVVVATPTPFTCSGYEFPPDMLLSYETVIIEDCVGCQWGSGLRTKDAIASRARIQPAYAVDIEIFSFALWAYFTEARGGSLIRMQTPVGVFPLKLIEFQVATTFNNLGCPQLIFFDGFAYQILTCDIPLAIGVWMQLTFVADVETAILYTDGEPVCVRALQPRLPTTYLLTEMLNADSGRLIGRFTDLKLYNTALDATAAAALAEGTGVADAGLVPLAPCANAALRDETPPPAAVAAGFDIARCTGHVPLCCLYDAAGYYINHELRSFLLFQGPCALWASTSSREFLADAPPAQALQLYSFPPGEGLPRVWCADAHRCTYEIPHALLLGPSLTTVLRTTGAGVDREMRLRLLTVRTTPGPEVELVLSEHALVFRLTHTTAPAEARHHVFSHRCLAETKPAFALWRADILAANTSCLWFCRPGFLVYPSSTDQHRLTSTATLTHACEAVPARVTVLEMRLHVPLDGAPPGDALAAVQRALEEALGLPRARSLLHVRRHAPDGLTLAAALLLDCGPGAVRPAADAAIAEAQLAAAVRTLQANATTTLLTAHVNVSAGPLRVSAASAHRHCPVRDEEVPTAYQGMLALWLGLIPLLAAGGLYLAVARVRQRRQRVLQRAHPLLQPGFHVPDARL